jgi:hypothetical protein
VVIVADLPPDAMLQKGLPPAPPDVCGAAGRVDLAHVNAFEFHNPQQGGLQHGTCVPSRGME